MRLQGGKKMAEYKGVQDTTPEQDKQLEEARDTIAKEAEINRVIRGKNNIFIKEYDLKEMGLKFTLKIRFPNVIEQAKISAMVERYFEGIASYMSPALIKAYRMLSTIHVCGEEVPSIFEDDSDIYNIQLISYIAEDFNEWLDTFHY